MNMDKERTNLQYNSAEGWHNETNNLVDSQFLSYYKNKDFWAEILVYQLQRSKINLPYIQASNYGDEPLISNIISMISFYEWQIYLYKLFHYLKKGRIEGIFTPKITVKECNFPIEISVLDIDFYTGIKFKYVTNKLDLRNHISVSQRLELIDKKESKYETLWYWDYMKNFTILDIAIALHSCGNLTPDEFISDAERIGATEFHRFEYEIPIIVQKDTQEYEFKLDRFNHYNVINNYKAYNRKTYRSCSDQHSSNPKMFNILTGKYVESRDGTFYLDDFR